MRYPLTFITDRFVPEQSGACMRVLGILPVIFIRPKYRGDEGLYRHELEHVKQAFGWLFPPVHAVLNAVSKRYRYECEIEAYREQLRYTTNPLASHLFADFILTKYDLDALYLSREDIIKELEK